MYHFHVLRRVKISAIHFYSVGVEQCDHMNVIFDKLSEESKYKVLLFSDNFLLTSGM